MMKNHHVMILKMQEWVMLTPSLNLLMLMLLIFAGVPMEAGPSAKQGIVEPQS